MSDACDEAEIRSIVPQAQFGRLVGCGHFPNIEQPAQVALALFLDFFRADLSIARGTDKPVTAGGIGLLDNPPFFESDQAVFRPAVAPVSSGQFFSKFIGIEGAIWTVGDLQCCKFKQVSRGVHPFDEFLLDTEVALLIKQSAPGSGSISSCPADFLVIGFY